MAERIVSPGVFTRERDLSFLPQSIGEIGAAIIGPTQLGPAFTPTQITSFQEFEELFGKIDDRFYTPYTVEQYLQSAGVVTVVRVLGIGGYQAHSLEVIATRSNTSKSLAVLAPSYGGSGTTDLSSARVDGTWSEFAIRISASETYSASFDTGSSVYIDKVINTEPTSTKSGGSTSFGLCV